VDSPSNPPLQNPRAAGWPTWPLLLIRRHHFGHQLLQGGGGRPAQLLLCPAGITQQGFHLRQSEITEIDAHHHSAGVNAATHFLQALTLPLDGLLATSAPDELLCCQLNEAPHRFLPPGGDHEVFRGPFLLQQPPLHLHVIPCVAPVAQRIKVAHEQALIQPGIDVGQAAGIFRVTKVSPRLELSWLNRTPLQAYIP